MNEKLDPCAAVFSQGSASESLTKIAGVLSVFFFVVTLILSAIAIGKAPEWGLIVTILAFLWAVGAPIWFWFEYFFLYRKDGVPGSLELYKHGQQVSFAIWAGLTASLVALANSDMFKKSEIKECSHTLATQHIEQVVRTIPASDINWTIVLSSLLTPTIAIFGSLIAYRQWRTAQNKLKSDLFEKRFKLYETIKSCVSSSINSRKLPDHITHQLKASTGELIWLINKDASKWLDEIIVKINELDALQKEDSDNQRQKQIRDWLQQQLDENLEKKFASYLYLSH